MGSENWTDEEFLRYVETHSRTERHMFSLAHAKRLVELAGHDSSGLHSDFIGIDAETADYYITIIRNAGALEAKRQQTALEYARGCVAMADVLYRVTVDPSHCRVCGIHRDVHSHFGHYYFGQVNAGAPARKPTHIPEKEEER